VECRCAVAEKVARTLVELEHVLPELADVMISQGPLAKNHTLVLSEDVIGAFVLARGQVASIRFEVGKIDRAKRFRPDGAGRRFAVFPQLIMFSLVQWVLRTGTADHHREAST